MRALSVFVVVAAVGGPNPCAGLLHAKGEDAGAAPAATTVATVTAPAVPPVNPANPTPKPAAPLPAAATGAQHLARGQQLEAQGKLDDASKEYDAAADRFRVEGNLEASVDARRKSAAAQEKLADQILHGTGPKPAPGPAPAPAPAPAPGPAAGGIPNGLYLCHGIGANGMYAVVRRIQITGSNYLLYTYNDKEKLPGTYSLAGTKINWLSGPLVGHGQGDYMVDTVTKGNMVLVFIDTLTPVSGAHRCYITNG